MRNTYLFALLLALGMLAAGCPVSLEYPLGEPGTEKIDPELLGTWVALADSAEILEVEITKKDDYSYGIEVIRQSENYMVDETIFTGGVTKLDGQSFLYATPVEGDGKYYHYHYDIKRKKLSIEDTGLLVGGIDAVTSTEALRAEVSASMKNPECFSGRFEYEKKK